MQLDKYRIPHDYKIGSSIVKQFLWYFIGSPLVETRVLPVSYFKLFILRIFGANLGKNIRIKPGVKIKFPWKLSVGNHCWIGENVWFDNLDFITVEDNVCISQNAYFCTGNHDWSKTNFDLKISPIYVGEGSWIAAKAVLCPGIQVGKGAVLTIGSVALKSLDPMTIYSGNPARAIKKRAVKL